MTPRETLRDLLSKPEPIVAPGVYEGISAALVRNAGFSAAYMTGAGVAAGVLGRPDIGLTTLTEMRQAAERFTSTLGAIPLIADADTGFGDVTHVYRTIGEYERAGVSAIQIEDQAFPKRCGHLTGKEVIPAEDFVLKLRAAQEARTVDDFLIIARTDAIAPLGFEEAMRRGKLYEEAGADILFIEAPQTLDQIKAIPESFGIPCLFNDVPRGHTPSIEHAVLGEYGYRIVIAPAACMGAAAVAIEESLRALQQAGGTDSGPHQLSPKELFDVLGLEFWQDLSERYDSKADSSAPAAQRVSE